MMDILMYLFETYIHSDVEVIIDQDELADELSRAGFHQDDIYKALNWLEKLAQLQNADKQPYLSGSAQSSIRVFTEQETRFLDQESRGFFIVFGTSWGVVTRNA